MEQQQAEAKRLRRQQKEEQQRLREQELAAAAASERAVQAERHRQKQRARAKQQRLLEQEQQRSKEDAQRYCSSSSSPAADEPCACSQQQGEEWGTDASSRGSSRRSSSSSGGELAQQQQPQEMWEWHKTVQLTDAVFEAKMSMPTKRSWGSPVAWWCAGYDMLCLWTLQLAMAALAWVTGILPRLRVRLGILGQPVVGLLLLLCARLAVAVTAVDAGRSLWQQSWQLPLELLTELVDLTRGGSPGLTLTHQQREAYLAEGDTLLPAAIKLGLASVSAFAVWTIYWCLCVAQLGSHSVGGWLLAVVLRLAVWLWRLLVWAPPSWYPVQLLAAVLLTGPYLRTDYNNYDALQSLRRAMIPLQVMITTGGWPTVCSLVTANWLYYFWDEGDMDWWQCVLCATAPFQVQTLLMRLDVGWALSTPFFWGGKLLASCVLAVAAFLQPLYHHIILAARAWLPCQRLLLGVVGWLAGGASSIFAWAAPRSVVLGVLHAYCGMWSHSQQDCKQVEYEFVVQTADGSPMPHALWFDIVLTAWLFVVLYGASHWPWYAVASKLERKQQAKQEKVQQLRQLKRQLRREGY